MRLSTPIYRLKRRAKLLSRKTGIPLNEALNKVATEEGFKSWSLLARKHAAERPAARILGELAPGDLVLLGARPEHGKTLMALEIVVEAIKGGAHGAFFSLAYNEIDVLHRLQSMGVNAAALGVSFGLDTSDDINATYIVEKLRGKPHGTVVAVDYLQILDQRRDSPDINRQIAELKVFAKEAGHIIILISQIDRKYELSAGGLPTMADVRLPNPLDLSLFAKSCFLSEGELKLETVA